MKRSDVDKCYSYFDLDQSGSISREEFAKIISLTEYEIDLALERIRVKLLQAVSKGRAEVSSSAPPVPKLAAIVARVSAGVLGAGSVSAKDTTGLGVLKIREGLMLRHVFKLINKKADNILSLDEVLDLSSKVEVFLSEEEASKVLAMMDVNGDDRVEEADFISFMKRESTSVLRKAYRVKDASALFRRWLLRGTVDRKADAKDSKGHP